MELGRKPRAIALLSGGLDSTLAAKVVSDLGVDVTGLHLVSPFGCRSNVQRNAEAIGVPVVFREKGEAYLDLVKNPRFGYGSEMNPCIDCRIFMFQLADVVRQDIGADFIITGEVLGQRPMSQQRNSMALIDKHSPLKDRTLRPLSAHLLEPTLPERNGWIDREKLFRISGRSRKAQLELAKSLKITDFETPGGGCLLTESSFSGRVKDFFEHDEAKGETRMSQSGLLRLGRHFRLSNSLKVVVGRNEKENGEITELALKAHGVLFEPEDFAGPVAFAIGPLDETGRQMVAKLIARYSKGDLERGFSIRFQSESEKGSLKVFERVPDTLLEELRIQ